MEAKALKRTKLKAGDVVRIPKWKTLEKKFGLLGNDINTMGVPYMSCTDDSLQRNIFSTYGNRIVILDNCDKFSCRIGGWYVSTELLVKVNKKTAERIRKERL